MRRVLALVFLFACSNPPPPQAWPAGNYCVLRDGSCPRATNGVFEKGSIVIDTDDGFMFSGAHGSSKQGTEDKNDGLLSIEVCCGTFDDTGASFPKESFVVLAGGTVDAPSCPKGFTAGSVFIDAEDDEVFGDDADSTIAGNVGASAITVNRNVDIMVCEAGPALDGFDMPRASYCVLAGRDGCPEGFSMGTIESYDETSGNKNEITGTVGSIAQRGASTTFPVCCN